MKKEESARESVKHPPSLNFSWFLWDVIFMCRSRLWGTHPQENVKSLETKEIKCA